MSDQLRKSRLLVCLLVGWSSASWTEASSDVLQQSATHVVILGSGTPYTNPNRSGPAVAVIVNDEAYLVDFGPGVVRRAAALSTYWGGPFEALNSTGLTRAFLTHLHSDHTIGLPDLMFSPWSMYREEPLEVFGPEGIVEMVEHIQAAYSQDVQFRLHSEQPANDQGWRVNAHVVQEGKIYQDENVSVEAFRVQHGTWPNAFGYRFTTPDKTIVISGDTTLSENLEKYSRGANILVHEAYSVPGLKSEPKAWQDYHRNFHTSTHELADLAARVKPDLLVLYHVMGFGHVTDEALLQEVRERYDGKVVLAGDLDVY